MRFPGPALVLLLFLAGCAVPPAVTVASLIVDGVSYVSTGKSSTDHAISAIANEDCALLRVVDDKPICDPDGDVLVALTVDDVANENWSLDAETGFAEPAPLAQAEAQAQPVGDFVVAVAPQPSPPAPTVAAKPIFRLSLQDGDISTYAVIGSFRDIHNARRMVASRGQGTVMQSVEVEGQKSYRVLVDQPLEQARLNGFPDAWPVRLCSGDLEVPPCSELVADRTAYELELASIVPRR
ncbi:MAG: SPOR domain-containing protein [Alphaproteobacteria bacterium]|nr:SPOR domain-containing protein [Alphaproteobacteria bacterium]